MLIKIPCKPYIREFIKHYYGSEVIELSFQSSEYKKISTIIRKAPLERKQVHASFSSFVSLRASDWLVSRKRLYIYPSGVYEFHKMYDDIFKLEFMSFVNDHYFNPEKQKIKNIILDFLALYNWTEDDIKIDALTKHYYRHRPAFLENKSINFASNDRLVLDLSFSNSTE
jgi:hypothetical protein